MVRSLMVAPAMAARNGPTSPSSRQVSRPSPTHVGHARHAVEAGAGPVEAHLHVALAPRQQGRDVLERHQPALADDRHAVADALHLGQDVRREEDRPAGRPQVVEDLVERALHERIEALGRLVEDRQLRDRAGAPG